MMERLDNSSCNLANVLDTVANFERVCGKFSRTKTSQTIERLLNGLLFSQCSQSDFCVLKSETCLTNFTPHIRNLLANVEPNRRPNLSFLGW